MSEWDFDGFDFVDDFGNPIEDDGYRDVNDDPSIDDADEENYDAEDDSWSDADTFTSIGWGTDEDYGYYGHDLDGYIAGEDW